MPLSETPHPGSAPASRSRQTGAAGSPASSDALGWGGKCLFFWGATPTVLRAAWRLHRRRGERLDVLVPELRRVRALRPSFLRRPAYLAATAERWLPLLPPRSFGRCLHRSLLLLDLWSRCGLDPILHLGVSPAAERSGETGPHGASAAAEPVPSMRRFHAWVTSGPGGPCTSHQGHVEIWRG